MNGAHLHLMLNHVPVVGFIFATLLLACAWRWGGEQVRLWALAIVVFTGLSGLPAFFTGESAEEAVEHLVGTNKAAIEPHEDLATAAVSIAGATALLAAAVFFQGWRQKKVSERGLVIVGAASAAALVLMGLTANRGGIIRHAELQAPAAATPGHGD